MKSAFTINIASFYPFPPHTVFAVCITQERLGDEVTSCIMGNTFSGSPPSETGNEASKHSRMRAFVKKKTGGGAAN